jgi:hypothetical protein
MRLWSFTFICSFTFRSEYRAGEPPSDGVLRDQSSSGHTIGTFRAVTRNAPDRASFGTMAAVVGYVGEDETLELRLSPDGDELAIFDLLGQRRPCAARLTADRRAELAAALARMAETAQRSEYSDVPAKVTADGGGRVDIAALPARVAIYVFRPGAWASRSVRLAPADARRLAGAMQPGGAGDALPSSG